MHKHYTLRISRICVITERKILLVQRDKDSLWEIPGGKVKRGESYFKAAHRELYEETGLGEASLKRIISERRETPHGGAWIGTHYYQAMTWKMPSILAPSNPHEIRDICWFTLAECLHLKLTTEAYNRLADQRIIKSFGE